MLSRFFRLAEHGTTVSRELQAGLTTFAAMAYILAVNPAILANAGMDHGALVSVTAITAAISTIIMALLTNYPIALAPGMGINAFFAFTICLADKIPWQQALGMVFVNGLIFLLLSVTGVREKIMRAIPYSLKIAITCGIGLFIAFIGLQKGGIIIANPATYVTHGDFASGPVALCFGGIILTVILVARGIPGAIVLSIAVVTVVGLFVTGDPVTGAKVTAWPKAIVDLPQSISPVFLQLRFDFLKSWSAFHQALPIIFTLLLIDMFDNIGTLIGVAKRAGYLDEKGELPKAGRALLADSTATILSSLFGTSTVVSYIESASGVEAGGRTGLTTMTTAVLMLLSLFFSPLILMVPAVATAPALVIVGIFMMQSIIEIPMGDFKIAAPAVLTLLAIPLSFSIAAGIGFGLISAALLAIGTGKPKEFAPIGYLIAGVFFLEFFHIVPFRG